MANETRNELQRLKIDNDYSELAKRTKNAPCHHVPHLFSLVVPRLERNNAMDRLEEAFSALVAHIDKHGHKGPTNGYDVIAIEIGMTMEDQSDGNDIDQSFEMVDDGGTIAFSYFLLPPMDDGQAVEETYRLTLTRTDAVKEEREWLYVDGKLNNQEPLSQAA